MLAATWEHWEQTFIGITMPTNDEILEQGLRKAKQAIYKAVWRQMKSLSVELVKRAVEDYDSGKYRDWETDRKSTRLNSSHSAKSRMPSSA